MKADKSVIPIGKYRIHVETYQHPNHAESVIMVNGALACHGLFYQLWSGRPDDCSFRPPTDPSVRD